MFVPTFKIRPALLACCALLLSYAAIWWIAPRHMDDSASQSPTNNARSAQASSNNNQDSGLTEVSPRGFGPDLDKILAGAAGPQRFTEFRRVLLQWIEQNPSAALAYVRNMKPCAEYDDALLLVLPALAETNPERAIRLAGEMTKTPAQQQVYAILFDQVATNDLSAAVHLLDSASFAEGRILGLRAIAATWGRKDFDGAVAWAKALDNRDREVAFETILQPLCKDDPSRALELAKEHLSGSVLLQVASTSLIHLSAEDASAAAEVMATLPVGIFETPAALEVARALATDSADSALAFLTNFASVSERRIALNNVLDIWSNSRPGDAARYVSEMAAGEDQNEAASHLAQRLAATDPDQAIEFAGSLKSNPARDAAMLYIASGWGRQDPEAAAEWSVTIPADCTTRPQAINAALSFWVLDDPQAAAEWAEKLPPADQLIALGPIAPAFAQKDPENAISWATNLPAGDTRNAAIQQILERWTASHPDQASRWAQTHKTSIAAQ